MYIPKHYSNKDQQQAIAFMKRFNFGTLLTSVDEIPVGTHLPFVIEERKEELVLIAHMARANSHWQSMDQQSNLVIFAEPHAYISPEHYLKEENVPTWNYLAVHAYGQAKIITGETELVDLLEHAIGVFDPSYLQQWEGLSKNYKAKMVKGIIGFEIVVTDLQFKEKLSQNKKAIEVDRISESLSKSEHTTERNLATYMHQKDAGDSKISTSL